MSTREQTPAFRAKRAVQEIAVKKRGPQFDLRERLVKGQTNGTRNHNLIGKALRFVDGGRSRFVADVERAARNGDSEARDWWSVYSDLIPAQQARVNFDDVCEAAGVPPDRILAVAVSQAVRMGQDVADYIAAVAHPDIVATTVRSAKRIAGPHAGVAQRDRELMLHHGKFLPQKGPGTSVTVNANAHAAAQAAAASQPSVPTFSESLQAPIEASIVVQRQLTEAVEAD